MRIALAAGFSLLFCGVSLANPTGGTVTSGSATISQSGSTVTVNTSTSSTIINWQSFSIAAGETTRINQPSSSSTVMNRVTGTDGSNILGTLSSNGNVFLVNPNGIVFAPGSQIDVASLILSTTDISDATFLSGLPGTAPIPTGGSIINTSTTGGVVVSSSGTLTISQSSSTAIINTGSFNIGSGDAVRLTQPGTGTAGVLTVTGTQASGPTGILVTTTVGDLPRLTPPSSGAVILRGTSVPTPSQIQDAVAQAAVSRPGEVGLNLEKREVSF